MKKEKDSMDLNKLQEEAKTLQQDIETLEKQNNLLKDLQNLENQSYYRQQKLALQERGVIALERIAEELEKDSDDDEDEDKE